jgi:hypothetical protein
VASYDFSAPYVAVRIVDAEGNTYPFWVDVSRSMDSLTSEEVIEIGSMAFLQTATVELNFSMLPKLSVNIVPDFEAGIRFLDSKLADAGGANILEVQLGYTTGTSEGAVLSAVYGGLILNPEVSIGEEISITLNASGIGGYSAARQTGGRTPSEGESRRDFLTRLARGPGGSRDLEMDFSEIDDPLTGDATVKAQLDAPLSYSQGGRSDWFAIWEITNAIKCWVLLVGNKVRVMSISKRLSNPPTREFYLHHYPGGLRGLVPSARQSQEASVGAYPILSFESPTNAVYLPGSLRGYVMEGVSDTSRAAVRVDVNDRSEAPTRTTDGTTTPDPAAMPEAEDNGDGGERASGAEPSEDEELATHRAEWQASGHMGITVEIETIGIPDIIPGEIVLLRGVGRRFSEHRYGVHKVTHNIGTGGFTTSLTLVTNIGSLADFGEVNFGPGNTQPLAAEEDGETSVSADTTQAAPPFELDQEFLDLLNRGIA